jgi:hypothetical protein
MSGANNDRFKTLDELDGDILGDPSYSSHLVTECHRLRKVPLHQFTAENLRIMIGQDIGLPYLVPIALEMLERDPWTSGDFFKGDLLLSVLRVDADFWRAHSDLPDSLQSIFCELEQCLELMQTQLRPAWMTIYQALYKTTPP